MNISNTIGVRVKPDSTYGLKHLAPTNTPLKAVAPNILVIDDTLSISNEAQAFLEEAKENRPKINDYSQEELDAMLNQLKTDTDDANNPLKIKLQCLKIAMRIMDGDNVPRKDWAFLAEHEPAMLAQAMLLRRQKENPKNHKSILEDEKTENPADATSPVSSSGSEGATEESVGVDSVEVSVDVEAQPKEYS